MRRFLRYAADHVVSIGAREDEDAIARHLYKILREFDDWNVDAIYSESFATPLHRSGNYEPTAEGGGASGDSGIATSGRGQTFL